MLEQSHTSLKKEVKIKTVPEILLCHFSCKTLANVLIKFKNRGSIVFFYDFIGFWRFYQQLQTQMIILLRKP